MHMQRPTCVKMRYFKVCHCKIARFLGVPSDARPQLQHLQHHSKACVCFVCKFQFRPVKLRHHMLENIIILQNNGSVLEEVDFFHACCEHTSSLNSLLVCFDDAVLMGKLAYLRQLCNFIYRAFYCTSSGGMAAIWW